MIWYRTMLMAIHIWCFVGWIAHAAENTPPPRDAARYPMPIATLKDIISGKASVYGYTTAGNFNNLKNIYKARKNRPLWYRGGQWTEAGILVHRTLMSAGGEGLNPWDYLPHGMQQLPHPQDKARAGVADALLTAGILRYAIDVGEGRFTPKPQMNSIKTLKAAIKSGDVKGWLANLPPKSKPYLDLREALRGKYGKLTPEQIAKIRINLERLRWYPEITDHRHIRVNLAGYELEAYEGRKLVLSMPVVVGRATRQTPVLQDKIVNVKFSPDWNAPKSIITRDYVPKLLKDRNYLSKKPYEVTVNGQTVPANRVDWRNTPIKNITLRHLPHKDNPLGGVRFSLTNQQGIYLHDTPNTKLFKQSERGFSSGCVRVGDAAALAKWVLRNTPGGWTDKRIQSHMKLSEPLEVPVADPVAVQLIYLTAWVNKDGILRFAEDHYGHDRAIRLQYGY